METSVQAPIITFKHTNKASHTASSQLTAARALQKGKCRTALGPLEAQADRDSGDFGHAAELQVAAAAGAAATGHPAPQAASHWPDMLDNIIDCVSPRAPVASPAQPGPPSCLLA